MDGIYIRQASPSSLITYAVRLKPGDEIMSKLLEIVEKENLKAAFIMTCVGSVTKARLRMANSVTVIQFCLLHEEPLSNNPEFKHFAL